MRTKDIIQPLVGTKNIVVKDILLDTEFSDLVISAWPTKKERCRCGLCHHKAKYYAMQGVEHAVGVFWILVSAKYLSKLLRPVSAARSTALLLLTYLGHGTIPGSASSSRNRSHG